MSDLLNKIYFGEIKIIIYCYLVNFYKYIKIQSANKH
jgi:hypothetical protein